MWLGPYFKGCSTNNAEVVKFTKVVATDHVAMKATSWIIQANILPVKLIQMKWPDFELVYQ